MEKNDNDLRRMVKHLLDTQQLAVLSTQRHGQPYSSLMAFAHTDELKTILVATGKATRKHENILTEPRVSLLIDNRTNENSDFEEASALTALGTVERIHDQEEERYRACYLSRHPDLEKFCNAPTTLFAKITIHHYLLVQRFQKVRELHLSDGTEPLGK